MIPIISFVQRKSLIGIVAFVVIVIFFAVSYNEICYVQQSLAALFFGILGYMFKPMLDSYAKYTSAYKGMGWITLLIVAFISTYNEPVGMYINQYGIKPLFVLTSLLGIFAVLDISVSLKNSTFLQWCGRVSIIIYVWQFSLSRVSMAFVSALNVDSVFSYIASFLLCLVLLVPITLFSNKYLYKLFGK